MARPISSIRPPTSRAARRSSPGRPWLGPHGSSAIFRFLHTGDLHLDSPFRGISAGGTPEPIVEALRQSTIRAWERVIDLALAERVDFVVVAGDAFENERQTLTGQLRFRDGLVRLAEAGIHAYVVTGNHDPLRGWAGSIRYPDTVRIFGPDSVSAFPVVRDGVEIARVYGVSYAQKEEKRNLAAGFRREADAPFAIGLLHTNVGGDRSAGDYAPCTIDDLRRSGMDYWALGHIHAHRVVIADGPVAVYCGNPQGRDPGETDPRGCYIVTVDDAGRAHPEFRPVDVVRWQLLGVPIDGVSGKDGLLDAIVAAAEGARSTAGRSIVARLTLTGRGDLHDTLRADPGLVGELLEEARRVLGGAGDFAWIESLRDETRPQLDLDALEAGDSLRAAVVRRIRAAQRAIGDDAPLPPEAAATVERLFGNGSARRLLEPVRPSPARLRELLAEAELLVVEGLADGSRS